MSEFCCESFAKQFKSHKPYAGGGLLTDNPSPQQIEQSDDGTWNIIGCCGGCYVITKMKFCPFCGSVLPNNPKENQDAV